MTPSRRSRSRFIASRSSRLPQPSPPYPPIVPSGGDDPMARDQQADRVPARRRHRPPEPPAVPRPAGRSRRSSRSSPTGSPRPPRGPACPTTAGRPGRMRRRGRVGRPASRPSSAADRRHRGGSGADRRAGTSRAFSTRRAEALRQVGVERRLGRQPGDGHDTALRGGEVERPPRARDRRADGGVDRASPRVSHSRPDAILPGSMNTPPTSELTLPIEGMTCASCVSRIERFLGKTPGVEEATVNLATETATVRYRPDVADRSALVGAIEAAGYDVRTRPPVDGSDVAPTLAAQLGRRSTANALERPVASSSGRWPRSRSPPGSWSSCSRPRRRSR